MHWERMRFAEATGEIRINGRCAWKAHFMFVGEINFRLYKCLHYPTLKELYEIGKLSTGKISSGLVLKPMLLSSATLKIRLTLTFFEGI